MAKPASHMQTFTEVAHRDDIFIAVMGLSGSGKSSLIRYCTKKKVIVGHSLSSCTTTVSMFSFNYKSRSGESHRVHLIDTPGFNDSKKSDVEILQEIVFWLTQGFDNGFLLDGIVYLHNITMPRFDSACSRSIEILKALTGPRNYKCIYLASTFWDNAKRGDEQLAKAWNYHSALVGKFWKELIDHGAQYRRPPHALVQGQDSYVWAVDMIEHYIEKNTKHVLRIQSEMRAPDANLRQTTAAVTAGELWRLDEKRRAEIPMLNRNKEELNAIWTKAAMNDVESLKQEIESLKRQLGQKQAGQNQLRPSKSLGNLFHRRSQSNLTQQTSSPDGRQMLEERIEKLEQEKETKLSSYGFWVNMASAAFGGVSTVSTVVGAAATIASVAAPVAPVLLAACTIM